MNKVAEIIDLEFSEFDLEQNSEPKVSRLTTQFPLVSIIVPVYNGSKYIKTAIESIFEQTYSNYEVIVVDDGSTDNTREILKPYEDRIYYLYQANEGSASARNLGIKVAKGELIAFLDADDYWSIPEKLTRQVACFNNEPMLGCVNTGWRIVNGDNEHIKTVQPWHKAPELNLETWLKRKCVRTSAMIFRREWLEKVGGFDEELKQSHDVDLILRLSLAGCKFTWLKEDTVCYRQHEANTTKNSVRQAKYVRAVLDKFFANQNLPEHIRETESQTRYHTLVWLAWYQYRANNLDMMSEFLQKSLDVSPYLRVENIAHWITNFERFSQERGETFDAASLTSTLQWQQTLFCTLRLKTNKSNPQIDRAVVIDDGHRSKNNESGPSQIKIEKQQKPQKPPALKSKSSVTKSNPSNLTANSQSFEDLCKLAEIEINKGDINHALTLYEKALKLNPNSSDINLKMGECWQKMGNLKQAIASYRKAIALEPNSWKTRRKLGKILRQQGDLELALAEFQQVIKLQPKIGEVHIDLGETLAQLGKWDEAISFYRGGIKLSPTQPWAYYKLANLQEKQHQFEDAVSSLEKAIKYSPNNDLFYRNLAQTQQILGNLDEAIVAYRQAIKINPDFELTVYRNLGQAIQHNNAVKARTGLNELAQILSDRVGKIAYLGAAPTAQKDGYMMLLQDKLNEYFQQSHVAIPAANGGISSNAAVFTMDRDVIKHKPNLCFIEYSSADMGKGYPIGLAVEGMVKKLIAIDCQICFIYSYKQGQKFDDSDPILSEYEKIAEFYGIPSINVGKHLEKCWKQKKIDLSKLFKSKDKTLPAGAKLIADFIFNGLKDIFQTRNRNTALINQHTNQKRYINENNYAQAKIVEANQSMIVDRENYSVGKFQNYQYYQIDSSNEIQFTIQGMLVGITTIVGQDSGIISLKTSGYEREYKLWDSYCFTDRFQALIIQRYFKEPTLVTLKLTDKPVDYSQSIKKIDNIAITKSFKLAELLVSGNILEA